MSDRKRTRKGVANELCILYHEAIRGEVAKATKSSSRRAMPAHSLDDLSKADRRSFIAAARVCIEEGADAREYIVAQFAVWREASAYHKKLLWPSPHHLGGLSARVRYLQHKSRDAIRIARVGKNEDQDETRRWYVEERRLKGLARMQRRDPVDVLTEQPEQFSREFLKHKGVWDVVRSLWEDREHS